MRRRYVPGEDVQVRVYLKGGDDRRSAMRRGSRREGPRGRGPATTFWTTAAHPLLRLRRREPPGEARRHEVQRPAPTPARRQPGQPGCATGEDDEHRAFLRAGAGWAWCWAWSSRRRASGSASTRMPTSTCCASRTTLLADFGGYYTYGPLRTDSRARFAIDADISDLRRHQLPRPRQRDASPSPEEFTASHSGSNPSSPSYRPRARPGRHRGPGREVRDHPVRRRPHAAFAAAPYGSDDWRAGGAGPIAPTAATVRAIPRKGVYVATEVDDLSSRPGASRRRSARRRARRRSTRPRPCCYGRRWRCGRPGSTSSDYPR